MTHDRTHNLSLRELDQRSVLHPSTAIAGHLALGPRIMTRAEGVMIYDESGAGYLDAVGGLWCVNVGYGRREIVDAMAAQAAELAYYHTFSSASNEPQIRLADRLLRMAPGRMSKVFFGNSGSDANDTQIKLVWYYNNLRGRPAKKKIISRQRGYHGTTVASASLTGLPAFHAHFDLPLPAVLHADAAYPYRGMADGMSERDYAAHLAAALEALIAREGAETIGAFIAEPVMGAGGVIVPPEGYFAAIQPILRRHDILLIADEVICGFGRLGHMFGSDAFAITPDLVSVAKGLTSGYFPMSACLISEAIWDVLAATSEAVGVFGHGFTYSGHPVGAATALANLDIIERERLVDNAAQVGAHLQTRLRAALADHPLVGEARGMGLIAGVELVADRASKQPFAPARKLGAMVARCALERGVIVRPLGGDILAISPPLTITEAEIDRVVEALVGALDETGDMVRAGRI